MCEREGGRQTERERERDRQKEKFLGFQNVRLRTRKGENIKVSPTTKLFGNREISRRVRKITRQAETPFQEKAAEIGFVLPTKNVRTTPRNRVTHS